MPKEPARRIQFGPPCEYEGCHGFAMAGKTWCRWHDPEVLRLKEEAEKLRQQAIKLAGGV